MFKVIVLAALLVAVAQAACPNLCSGHGSCGNDDMCTCYTGWSNGDEDQGDCSQRICPFERAWVDAPTDENVAHALAECAGRGICNRETGDCECFDGYTGQGCQRTVCPNDCSGHGTCEHIEELRDDWGDDFKLTGWAASTPHYSFDNYHVWDQHKTMGCQCDPKWTDVDCSRRQCPRSNYALFSNMQTNPEIQKVSLTNVSRAGADFALIFRSRMGEEFTTISLNAWVIANTSLELPTNNIVADGADFNSTRVDVQTALEQLPNFVLQGVEVSLNFSYGDNVQAIATGELGANIDYMDIFITFNGDQTTGDQYMLECLSTQCQDGCFPLLENAIGNNGGTCTVTEVYKGDASNMECSGRGKCNYDSGICECFEGYTDEACGTQTALI